MLKRIIAFFRSFDVDPYTAVEDALEVFTTAEAKLFSAVNDLNAEEARLREEAGRLLDEATVAAGEAYRAYQIARKLQELTG